MRQQLDLWARQAAAVRAGGLHLACDLGGSGDTVARLAVSPSADQVVVLPRSRASRAVLVPVTGTQLDPASQLAAQPPSAALAVPTAGPAEVVAVAWCPTGQHLALATQEHRGASLRVSTFRGTQLVGSFLEPLAHGEACSRDSLLVSDGAAVVFLLVRTLDGSRVVAATAQGTVTARHPAVKFSSTALLDCGQLLATPWDGDRLCVYSASGVQEISLHTADSHWSHVSGWGCQAAAVMCSREQVVLLLVDLVRHVVQHRTTLSDDPREYPVEGLAHGAHAAAVLVYDDSVSVIATSGGEVGRELFSCSGDNFAWDPLGRFLAVSYMGSGSAGRGVRILDGATGAKLALWRPDAQVQYPRWLADGRGLVVMTSFSFWEGFRRTGGRNNWHLLRFNA